VPYPDRLSIFPGGHLVGLARADAARGADPAVATRISWAWVLFEPVFHVAYLLVLYSAVRVRSVGNLDTPVWIMVGIQTFFLFRKTADHVAGAPADNSALLPIGRSSRSTRWWRAACWKGQPGWSSPLLLIGFLALWGHPFAPHTPLAMMAAWVAMWLLGVASAWWFRPRTTLMRETRQMLTSCCARST
jgi:capsular polysaccharide transport system permease protein